MDYPKSKLLKRKIITFDKERYELTKKEVNVNNNHRSIKVFIRKLGDKNTAN